jgi:hypothetical protein
VPSVDIMYMVSYYYVHAQNGHFVISWRYVAGFPYVLGASPVPVTPGRIESASPGRTESAGFVVWSLVRSSYRAYIVRPRMCVVS